MVPGNRSDWQLADANAFRESALTATADLASAEGMILH
jgi:hypothetical protein